MLENDRSGLQKQRKGLGLNQFLGVFHHYLQHLLSKLLIVSFPIILKVYKILKLSVS